MKRYDFLYEEFMKLGRPDLALSYRESFLASWNTDF